MAKYDPPHQVQKQITEDFWECYPDRKGEQLRYDFTQPNPIGGNAYWFSTPRTPYSFEWNPRKATARERLRIDQQPGD